MAEVYRKAAFKFVLGELYIIHRTRCASTSRLHDHECRMSATAICLGPVLKNVEVPSSRVYDVFTVHVRSQ